HLFYCSSRRRHTRSKRDWSSDVCSSDLLDNQDRPREWVQLRQLERVDRIPEPKIELSSTVDARSTVSDAMSAMLASSHGGAMVTRRGKYIGVISYDTVNDYIRSLNAAAAHDAADDSSPKEVDFGGEI